MTFLTRNFDLFMAKQHRAVDFNLLEAAESIGKVKCPTSDVSRDHSAKSSILEVR